MKREESQQSGAPHGGREPTYEEICNRAYQIWEREGRPEGMDKEHWSQAEQELRGQTDVKARGATKSMGYENTWQGGSAAERAGASRAAAPAVVSPSPSPEEVARARPPARPRQSRG